MSSSSLPPILDLEIPDLAMTAWREVLGHAWARSREITDQRLNIREINEDWQRLHNFEYQHFYSAWVGVAFRFQACAIHNQDFTEVFRRTGGTSQDMDLLYKEDDAFFGFFVKGLSALESFYYCLYALVALLDAPTVPPSDQFPLLDPAHPGGLRRITPANTHLRYTLVFPTLPITELLGRVQGDDTYQNWYYIRNVLAHRAATVGRTIQYPGPFWSQSGEPLSVRQWASDLLFDATTTASRYDWLRETINSGLEETAVFTVQQLVYTEDQLRQLAW